MVSSVHPQGLSWIQQQEEQWNDLVGSKMAPLQSMFKEHLAWFRQHRTTTSIISTRRALVDIDTAATADTPTKRRRMDDHDQQEQQSPPDNSNQDTPKAAMDQEFIFPSDGQADTDTIVAAAAPTIDEETRPQTAPPAVSRESLLRRFKEEEQRYGRYGLRNRSLDAAPKEPANAQQQERRQTVHPESRPSLSSILSSLHEHSKSLTPQRANEAQVDDEVQLVVSRKTNRSFLSESSLLLSEQPTDSSHLSRLFSFGQTSLLLDDTPKRPADSPRTSRLVSTKEQQQQPSPRKSTTKAKATPLEQTKASPPNPMALLAEDDPKVKSTTQTVEEEGGGEEEVPAWAIQPELDQLLEKQAQMDADMIFGRMPPVQVSRIVKKR